MFRRRFTQNKINTDNYLTVVALEDGWSVNLATTATYSIDGKGWKKIIRGESTPPIMTGQTISFASLDDEVKFTVIDATRKRCQLKGNVFSLVYGHSTKKDVYESIFFNMFLGWKGLESVPNDFLPATTLAHNCYSYMFYGCTSLTTAPELPATTLASFCYNSMFYGCTKLNYIKMLATDISASYCLQNWVRGISPTGTFVKNPEATWEVYGDNGIPNGWKVVMDGEPLFFYFNNTPYEVGVNMTWEEYVNSTYNNGIFRIVEQYIYVDDKLVARNKGAQPVFTDDKITLFGDYYSYIEEEEGGGN